MCSMDLEDEQAAALVADAALDVGSLSGSDEEASDGEEDEDFVERNAKVGPAPAPRRIACSRTVRAAPPGLPGLSNQVPSPFKGENGAQNR